jgi:TPR repeat protein
LRVRDVFLILTVSFFSVASQAEEVREFAKVFSPPALDYARICKDKTIQDLAPGKPDTALAPKGKLRRARILIDGSASVIPDKTRAAGLLKEVIASGAPSQRAYAAYYLGKLYALGEGVSQDEAEAEKLWQQALGTVS